ncbi:MAG TPA: LysR family transcriptional regulator [Roseateles sp.]|nr:LysR family transcriptional regulator [Roseateles sp.]
MSAALLLNRLRLRQVALLLALRELGTLRAAAAQLGMTQPAATNMLKELEEALGVRLFERAGRGLQATAAGLAVTGHFDGLQGSMTALARDLEALRHGGGALAVGSILAPSPTLLTRTVARLKQEQPRLRVQILTETSDRLLDLLEQGSLDLVIGRMADGHAHRDHLFRALAGEPLAVVVGPQHALAGARRCSLAALADQPWILQPRGSPMRELLEREFRQQGLDVPADLVETASILSTLFLLAEAPMVAVVPASLAAPYADRGMLSVLPLKLGGELEPFGSIVRRGRPLSAAAQRFLALLHQDDAA